MIYLQVEDNISPQGISPVEPDILEKAALQTLKYGEEHRFGEEHSFSDAELQADMTVVLSDNAKLQQLNREYLEIDAPTDVLSFPGGDIDPDTQMLYLGDVIISFPRAASQAAVGGHPVEAELQLLVVHGTLHLLGHDHADPDGKARMWQAQAEVLASLGCPITGPASE